MRAQTKPTLTGVEYVMQIDYTYKSNGIENFTSPIPLRQIVYESLHYGIEQSKIDNATNWQFVQTTGSPKVHVTFPNPSDIPSSYLYGYGPIDVNDENIWEGYVSCEQSEIYKTPLKVVFHPIYTANPITFPTANITKYFPGTSISIPLQTVSTPSIATKSYSIFPSGASINVTRGEITINSPGTYTITCSQPAEWFQENSYDAGSASYTITVLPRKTSDLARKSSVNPTIYRSLPDGLDVSKLFTVTTTTAVGAGTLTYTLRNAETNAIISLTGGKTLPDDLPKGTYTIICNQAATEMYDPKSANVTLKIVGVYEKNISYSASPDKGSFSFDTHDMTEALGVTTPIYVWSATAENDKSLVQNGAPLHYTVDNTGNYRTLKTTDLTLKMPNTHFFEFLTDYPTYTKKVDTRTEADKVKCTEMKTDYVVEYNCANTDYYTASGYINSVVERGVDNTPVDFLRYTINIEQKIDFWSVPSDFSQGSVFTENSIADCPLTFGEDTYGATAGTNDDIDFSAGSRVFTHYAKGTKPANGNATTIPTTGTYYKFESSEDDYLLTVGIKLDKRCKFYLLDVDKNNGDAVTSRKDLGSELETWNGANGTVNIFTKANHDYYFFSTDEPLAIYGYWYNNNSVTKYYEKKGFLSRDKDYSK